MGPSVPSCTGVVLLLLAVALLASRAAEAVTIDGDLTYTSDYIYRGISQTAGRSAGQADAHLTTADGTFLGVFASTLTRVWHTPYGNLGWDFDLEEYLGHRFDLSQSWSATATAINYSYLGGNAPISNDYQELSLAISYLDSWTLTASAIPSAVRYERGNRLGRYSAYSADLASQWPIVGRLFLTAGSGYYTSDGAGYAYGNVGLSLEFKRLRVDAGYFAAQDRAQALFPYGRAGNRFAATVSWHF